jgi:hypothetical protein
MTDIPCAAGDLAVQQNMLRKLWPHLTMFSLALCCLGQAVASPSEASRLSALLAAMHPDHGRYIQSVRSAPAGVAPADLYLGLVRMGGRDPRDPADAPRPGARRRYDVLVFPPSSVTPWSEGWSRLLVDHEYFHARHLARGDRLPHPTFARTSANRHFQEALAWGYNLHRLSQNVYGALPEQRRREVRQHYRRHREALARYVRQKQPSAWSYYGRFLPAQ